MVKAVSKKLQGQCDSDQHEIEKGPKACSVEDRQRRLEDTLMNLRGTRTEMCDRWHGEKTP